MLTDFGLSRAEVYSQIDLLTSVHTVPRGTAPFMAYEPLEFIAHDGNMEMHESYLPIYVHSGCSYTCVL